jgi:hypothetical protein
MTEHSDVGRRLHDLGVAVARTVTAPPPAAVRARAMRWHISVRVSTIRLVIGLVAAGAVVAVVVGMTTVVRQQLAPTPPISWPLPPPSFSPSPRPTLPVPARPSVRVTDPIASVDWDGPGAVTLPKNPEPGANCPSGQVRLTTGYPPVTYPAISLDSTTEQGNPAYGDLNGDGRPEAVVSALCRKDKENSGDGQSQLLVVTRELDGTLRALAWVAPRGALYAGFWVADGILYVDARPQFTPFEYGIGDVFAYRWQGGEFVTVDSGYRGIQAFLDRDRAAASIDLSPVADLLPCPAAFVKLPPPDPRKLDDPAPTAVSVDGIIYDLAAPPQPGVPHWVDLGGDGRRYLLASFACRHEGSTADAPPLGQGVLVLKPVGDHLRAVDFVPVSTTLTFDGWRFEGGTLAVMPRLPDGSRTDDEVYTWNGHYFQR